MSSKEGAEWDEGPKHRPQVPKGKEPISAAGLGRPRLLTAERIRKPVAAKGRGDEFQGLKTRQGSLVTIP